MQKRPTRRQMLKLAGLLPLLAAVPYSPGSRPHAAAQSARPNVLVIVFDTLSAKHMSLYGYPRETTPNLARFADRATVFHRHYAGGNFTSPGTSALLTGSYPWTQRAFNFLGTVKPEYERKTMFRVFRDAGYHGIVYTHNWLVAELLYRFRDDIDYWKPIHELCLTNSEISERILAKDHLTALSAERLLDIPTTNGTGSLLLSLLQNSFKSLDQDRAWASLKQSFPRGLPGSAQMMQFVLEDAIDWMESEFQRAPQPFFGYVHLWPPHDPYNPRQEFIDIYDDDGFLEAEKPAHPLGFTYGIPPNYRRHYDEFLTYADSEFGRLYDAMTRAGVLDNTLLVFTSDHGEMLERETRGHFNPLLYEPIIRIPLIIARPGQTERVDVRTPTTCLDVLPTLASAIGQPIPDWCEGQVLPGFGEGPSEDRSIFTLEAKSSPKHGPLSKATVSMVKGDYKLIYYRGYEKGYDNRFELYDVKNDPEELTDLYESKTGIASELRSELLAALERVNKPA
ncbi:MAG: sulfatase [Rudaea sp.]